MLILSPMLATVACRSEELAGGVRDSTFVTAMAALERIERNPALDSAAQAAARAKVLQGQGLTRAQLERAAASLADDPVRAVALFRAIDAKVTGEPGSDAMPATPGRR